MRVVLVNPPFGVHDLYKDLSGGGSELPPLNLCGLAAVLREARHPVSIVDAMALRYTHQQTVEAIRQFQPDLVGITSTTMTIQPAAQLAGMCRQLGLPTVLGGAHLTAAPEETLRRYPQFDLGVVGEAEETILDLVGALEHGLPLEHILGIMFRQDGAIVSTPRRPFIRDLDALPLPAWDLLPDLVKYYQPAADSLYRFPASALVTSRGCPGQCLFCDRSVFGNTCRAYSAEYVLRMMRVLSRQYGIKDIFIHDDNFLLFRRRTQTLCEGIQREHLDLTWSCLGRVDMTDFSLLPQMKQAGCWQINYGCESGSQRILDILSKGTRVEQIEEAVRKTKEAGIRVKGLFMIGNFGETEETIEQTIRFIRRLPLDDFHMTCFTPLPGSEAYQLAAQYGEFDPSWERMNMFSPDSFIPQGLTRPQIQRHYRRAYRAFYFRPRIIWYYLRKLRSWGMIKKLLRAGFTFLKFLWRKPPAHEIT